jgi:cytochrome c-type biogenesis protein CcmH
MMARVALVLMLAGAAAATKMDPPPQGGDASGMSALDLRLKHLEGDLRCLVCQNQTLADSNADLAADLRREVRELALAGKSDDDIKAYLVARYGDFVLYDPPVKPLTWMLWFGPFALLFGGGAVWWIVLRRRERVAKSAATDAGAKTNDKARQLLDDSDR